MFLAVFCPRVWVGDGDCGYDHGDVVRGVGVPLMGGKSRCVSLCLTCSSFLFFPPSFLQYRLVFSSQDLWAGWWFGISRHWYTDENMAFSVRCVFSSFSVLLYFIHIHPHISMCIREKTPVLGTFTSSISLISHVVLAARGPGWRILLISVSQ